MKLVGATNDGVHQPCVQGCLVAKQRIEGGQGGPQVLVGGRAPVVVHGAQLVGGEDAPAEADAHARTLLAPLGDGGPLPETLRTWLSLHGSWDRTAAALSVHRNTVRQRVTRCATLLDVDLDDPDVRMELWFALGRTGGAG